MNQTSRPKKLFWRQLISEIRPDFPATSITTCLKSHRAVPELHQPRSHLRTAQQTPSDSPRDRPAGFWLLIPFSNSKKSLAVLMGTVFRDAEQEQRLLSFMEVPHQEHQGTFLTDGDVHVPLEVTVYLESLPGSSVLSSLPSQSHLGDTSSLVCGITSSSKLFLTLHSYSSSMHLTILKLIWVMTNRIRYQNHALFAAVTAELTGLMWNSSWSSSPVGGKAFVLCALFNYN